MSWHHMRLQTELKVLQIPLIRRLIRLLARRMQRSITMANLLEEVMLKFQKFVRRQQVLPQ